MMLLSRLFGNKFLIDERFFSFFFFFPLLFYFLFDRRWNFFNFEIITLSSSI